MLLTDDQRRFAGVYGPIKDRRGSPSPVPLVISVLAGLLAALFTLPADTEPAGALRLPAAMLATGLMGGITIRAIRLGFEEALHPECVITGGVVRSEEHT